MKLLESTLTVLQKKQARSPIDYFFIAFLVISSFFGNLSLNGDDSSQITLFRIALVINVIYNILKLSKSPSPFSASYFKYCFPFLFLPTFGLISITWSRADSQDAIAYFINFLCGCILTLLIILYAENPKRLNDIWLFFCIGASVQIPIAIYEILSGWRAPGSKFILENTPGYVIYLNQFTPTAFQGNPNNLAFLIGLLICCLLCFKKQPFLRIVLTLLSSIVLILAGSRTVLLSILGVLFYLTFFIWIPRSKKKAKAISMNFTTLLCLSGSVFTLIVCLINAYDASSLLTEYSFQKQFNAFSLFSEFLDDASDNSSGFVRRNLYLTAIQGVFETNLLGAGIGGSINLISSLNQVHADAINVHLFWLELLVDFGLFPFLIVSFWFFRLSLALYYYSKIKLVLATSEFVLASHILVMYLLFAAGSPSTLVYIWPFYGVLGVITATVRITSISTNQKVIVRSSD